MFSIHTALFLRQLVAALAVLAFVLAPAASAEIGGGAADAAYECGLACGDADAGEADHSDHDHHAHGCGSCHVHLIEPDAAWPQPVGLFRSIVRPLRDSGAVLHRPEELFRPPRT